MQIRSIPHTAAEGAANVWNRAGDSLNDMRNSQNVADPLSTTTESFSAPNISFPSYAGDQPHDGDDRERSNDNGLQDANLGSVSDAMKEATASALQTTSAALVDASSALQAQWDRSSLAKQPFDSSSSSSASSSSFAPSFLSEQSDTKAKNIPLFGNAITAQGSGDSQAYSGLGDAPQSNPYAAFGDMDNNDGDHSVTNDKNNVNSNVNDHDHDHATNALPIGQFDLSAAGETLSVRKLIETALLSLIDSFFFLSSSSFYMYECVYVFVLHTRQHWKDQAKKNIMKMAKNSNTDIGEGETSSTSGAIPDEYVAYYCYCYASTLSRSFNPISHWMHSIECLFSSFLCHGPHILCNPRCSFCATMPNSSTSFLQSFLLPYVSYTHSASKNC